MKIAFVTQFFSKGMGYTENMLPKYLSILGHEVLVLSSDLQVYGNSPEYESNYKSYLGNASCNLGDQMQEGFLLRRLNHYSIKNYIGLVGLDEAIREFAPDVVQFNQAAGLDTFKTLIRWNNFFCPIFTECHQHKSIAKNYLQNMNFFSIFKKFVYFLTRTFPSWLAHKRVEKCFAIAPDCLNVANTNYGIPKDKLVLLPLGTDTETFYPCNSENEQADRLKLRKSFGVSENEILVIYTGRFTSNKDPLILAKAINKIQKKNIPYKAIFVGSGEQGNKISLLNGCIVTNFQTQKKLASIYRAADIAVWPREESMSMLDAAASGLPLIVSNEMGEQARIQGNGLTYIDRNIDSLVEILLKMFDKSVRQKLGNEGRKKMLISFSWVKHAKVRIEYYKKSISTF